MTALARVLGRLPRRPADRFTAHPRDKVVRILGTHGVPASYGGFETAAENVALFLRDQGWRVVVYCQVQGRGPVLTDRWHGLERVLIPVDREGWLGTSTFDWLPIAHACRYRDVCRLFTVDGVGGGAAPRAVPGCTRRVARRC